MAFGLDLYQEGFIPFEHIWRLRIVVLIVDVLGNSERKRVTESWSKINYQWEICHANEVQVFVFYNSSEITF
jgi:hypothetical protein